MNLLASEGCAQTQSIQRPVEGTVEGPFEGRGKGPIHALLPVFGVAFSLRYLQVVVLGLLLSQKFSCVGFNVFISVSMELVISGCLFGVGTL